MPRQRTVLFVLSLVACVGSSANAAEPMRWKFEAGKQYRYQLVQATDTKLNSGAAGEIVTNTSQTIDMTWQVERVNEDGSAVLKHNIERVQMSMNAPMGQSFSFDTASSEAAEGLATLLAPTFNALVESGYTVTMMPDGKLGEIDAPEQLLQALKNLPGGGATASEKAIKTFMAGAAVALPDKPVEVGDEWSTASAGVSAPMFGELDVQTTYRYDGARSEGGETIEVFTPTVSVNATAPEGGQMTGTLQSRDTEGQIRFNRDAGRLEEATVKHTMAIDLTVSDRQISGTIDQTSTVKHGVQSEPPAEQATPSETAEPVGAQ